LMWMDLRASAQARLLTQTGDPVLRYCGGDVPAEWPLPKALWLKQHEPTLWAQAAYLVEQMGWLTWRLTGEWAIPLNSGAAKWLYRASTDAATPARRALRLLQAVRREAPLAQAPGAARPVS